MPVQCPPPPTQASHRWQHDCGDSFDTTTDPKLPLLVPSAAGPERDVGTTETPRGELVDDQEGMAALYIARELWARFRLLDRTDGPYATAVGREAEHTFWINLRDLGVRWLIHRLDEPREVRFIWKLSGLLAAIAPASAGPTLDVLEGAPSPRKADALLSAVSGMDPSMLSPHLPRIARLLERYLSHPDDAVRTQAAATTSVLAAPRAIALLQRALTTETNTDVRAALEEEIRDRS
jgi:hypothetical protein